MIGNIDGLNNDNLQGWALDEDDPSRRIPLQVFYNGRLLTTAVAGFPRPDLVKAGVGDGSNGFFVALPALDDPEQAEIQVVAADTQEPVGPRRSIHRAPKCSRTGILAAEMLRLQAMPLHSLSAVQFNGDRLVVNGMHLPPGGDPAALRVRSTPGIAFELTYPVFNRGAGDWYWYWPNGGWSGYRIEIDLAASTDDGPHFEFIFESDLDDPAVSALGRNRIHIPKDLGIYQRFPHGDQLVRVQRFDSAQGVALTGYSHYRVVAQIAEHYGVDLLSANVLDWGCGHGRVIRHFAQQGQVNEAWGVDVDPENVGWLSDNFPAIKASTVPLAPPTELPAQHFDFIFAISVMTHLTKELQEKWLAELKRITKPGGLVVLTFAGPSSVAFASQFLTPDWVRNWRETGFDDTIENTDLIDKIGDNDYYRNTKQSAQFTRELWGKHFEVVDVHPCIFGFQDVAVLRA